MKKFLLLLALFFGSLTTVNAETNRIISGNQNAKIVILAYESLTCSHCADFHKNVYPQLKKDYIDTGLAKIEFRHFPLDAAAFNASKIIQCKHDQGMEILESLYSNQQAWIKGNTIEQVNNKKIEEFVLNDRIEGVKNFKVNATPTIIINDKKFEKSLNYKNLKETLEKLI